MKVLKKTSRFQIVYALYLSYYALELYPKINSTLSEHFLKNVLKLYSKLFNTYSTLL